MRSRILVGTLVVGALTTGTVATSGYHTAPGRRWAIVDLTEPTLVGSTIVQGPVLISHDGSKMARGEPCTTVRLFEPKGSPVEEIASASRRPVRSSRNSRLRRGRTWPSALDASSPNTNSPARRKRAVCRVQPPVTELGGEGVACTVVHAGRGYQVDLRRCSDD